MRAIKMEDRMKGLIKVMVVLSIIAALIGAASVIAQEAAEISPDVKVGDIIRFGRYEQDNDLSNGAEAIEWRILAIEDNTALIVSVMGLDAKPYHEPGGDITWEDCTLRSWLNEDFYHTAFNEAERAKIERTHVVNEDNSDYSTKGGNDTEDDVFLLSIAEAERYFRDSEDRQLKPTKYAKANGAWADSDNGNGWWWLRSPGINQNEAAEVYFDGDFLYIYGSDVNFDDDSVRPALRINLGK